MTNAVTNAAMMPVPVKHPKRVLLLIRPPRLCRNYFTPITCQFALQKSDHECFHRPEGFRNSRLLSCKTFGAFCRFLFNRPSLWAYGMRRNRCHSAHYVCLHDRQHTDWISRRMTHFHGISYNSSLSVCRSAGSRFSNDRTLRRPIRQACDMIHSPCRIDRCARHPRRDRHNSSWACLCSRSHGRLYIERRHVFQIAGSRYWHG